MVFGTAFRRPAGAPFVFYSAGPATASLILASLVVPGSPPAQLPIAGGIAEPSAIDVTSSCVLIAHKAIPGSIEHVIEAFANSTP